MGSNRRELETLSELTPLIPKSLLIFFSSFLQNLFLYCLTTGKRSNAPKDYTPQPQSVYPHLYNYPLPPPVSPLPALLSAESRRDLNIINGFSGSTWIRFVSIRFIPALTLGPGAHAACFLDECPPPCQQSFARSLLINSSPEGGPDPPRKKPRRIPGSNQIPGSNLCRGYPSTLEHENTRCLND